MSIFNLFKNKNKDEPEKTDEIIESEASADIVSSANADEDNEELIAVISAAISAFLKKPVSGFRVVSFKKRGSWSNI